MARQRYTADEKYELALNRKHLKRLHREAETVARWERQDKLDAEEVATRVLHRQGLAPFDPGSVGQLCRNGRTIYYVYPVDGEYRESDSLIGLLN